MVRSKKRGTNAVLRMSKLEKYFVDNLRRMHFLCQIAHVLYLNQLASDPLLKVKRLFSRLVSGIEIPAIRLVYYRSSHGNCI